MVTSLPVNMRCTCAAVDSVHCLPWCRCCWILQVNILFSLIRYLVSDFNLHFSLQTPTAISVEYLALLQLHNMSIEYV